MRFTEINLFGVYVAPMSSMMGCRLGGDDRIALVPVAVISYAG